MSAKQKIAPWKIKARDVIRMTCQRWRGALQWECSPIAGWSDYVTVTVADDRVTASTEINLRLVWKGGQRNDFSYLETIIGRLMDDYYAKHEALRNPSAAAAQAWKEVVPPTVEKREIA